MSEEVPVSVDVSLLPQVIAVFRALASERITVSLTHWQDSSQTSAPVGIGIGSSSSNGDQSNGSASSNDITSNGTDGTDSSLGKASGDVDEQEDLEACARAALVCQLRCLATAAVCAHARDAACADSCARLGLMSTLLDLSLSRKKEEDRRDLDMHRVHTALMDRFHHVARYGEGEVPPQLTERPGAEIGIVSPTAASHESRREIEIRQREALRTALAMDLTALGYPIALCEVALQLNGEDPQTAAHWLLDSSASYVDSHPEVSHYRSLFW